MLQGILLPFFMPMALEEALEAFFLRELFCALR